MATTLHSDLVIRDELLSAGFIEGIGQNVAAFNANSQGTIVLETRFHEGDYTKRRFFDQIAASSITRRDLTSTAAATGVKITMDETIGVKVFRNAGPYDITEGSFRTAGLNMDEFSFQLGIQIANRATQAMLNSALLAAVAFITGQAGLYTDNVATGATTFALVNSALGKFGDARANVSSLVMHSASIEKLHADGLTNYVIDSVAGATVTRGESLRAFGRPIVLTDSASLVNTDGVTTGVDSHYGLGLVPRAATVTVSESLVSRQYYLDRSQVTRRLHPEFAYTLEVKGSKWDTTAGGANPDDTAVALSTNWDAVVADDKDKAGIVWEANEN